MTIEEGAKYVAAAYAVIMAVLIVYYFMSSRRVSGAQARHRAARERVASAGRRRPAGRSDAPRPHDAPHGARDGLTDGRWPRRPSS